MKILSNLLQSIDLDNIIIDDKLKVSFSSTDLFIKVINIKNYLNNKYETSKIIALYLDKNSNWIIYFLAILMSKHKLLIIPYSFSNSKAIKLIYTVNPVLLITDKPLDICDISILLINNHHSDVILKYDLVNSTYEKEANGIYIPDYITSELTYTTEDEIWERLKNNIFSEASLENTHNNNSYEYLYIESILMPLIRSSSIYIAENDDIYSLHENIVNNRFKTLFITSHKLELLYKTFIDNENHWLLNIEWIKSLIIKQKIKKLFNNIQDIIIIGNNLSPIIYNTLSRYIHNLTCLYNVEISSHNILLIKQLSFINDVYWTNSNNIIISINYNNAFIDKLTLPIIKELLLKFSLLFNTYITDDNKINKISIITDDFSRNQFDEIIKEYYE